MFDIFENNALNDEDKFFHTSILGRGMEGGGGWKLEIFRIIEYSDYWCSDSCTGNFKRSHSRRRGMGGYRGRWWSYLQRRYCRRMRPSSSGYFLRPWKMETEGRDSRCFPDSQFLALPPLYGTPYENIGGHLKCHGYFILHVTNVYFVVSRVGRKENGFRCDR